MRPEIGKAEVDVLNVSAYAKSKRYWIVRVSDSFIWFYSAWDTEDSAFSALAEENDGRFFIVENKEAKS